MPVGSRHAYRDPVRDLRVRQQAADANSSPRVVPRIMNTRVTPETTMKREEQEDRLVEDEGVFLQTHRYNSSMMRARCSSYCSSVISPSLCWRCSSRRRSAVDCSRIDAASRG